MPVEPGSRIGPYEVLGLIGAGGMGEVYRARDTQLKRDVALKVLPGDVAADPDRLARFQREAELLAALNHPRIAQIHGLVDDAGTRVLVMELVEGPTLADRLTRGKVPVDEALSLAVQLADAVEYAHEHGIIHRDLKPANIKLTPDGGVKVLDFGLAKALEGSPSAEILSDSPTITSPAMTRAGIILGTAAYMSPEQARGAAVDKRADIWGFGVVLFEMLTGRQCFSGDTVTDVLAAVVRAEPGWAALPAETPAHVRELLKKCLAKDRRQRLHDIGDARLEVEAALGELATPETASVTALSAGGRSGHMSMRERVAWASAALAIGLFVGTVAMRLAHVPEALPASAVHAHRFTFTLPPDMSLTLRDTPAVAVSPDGMHVVFSAKQGDQSQLYSRALDELELKPIPGTAGASMPFFSPDGAWVGFLDDLNLCKVPLAGGTPTTIGFGGDVRGASWGTDGWIVFTRNMRDGLWRVRADGGESEAVTTLDRVKQEKTHRFPQVLPDGRGVLFASGTGDLASYDDMAIVARRPRTGEQIVVVRGGMVPQYVVGHIVFARGGAIFTAPFDSDRLAVTGPEIKVVSGVRTIPSSGSGEFSVSPTGTLAYVSGDVAYQDSRIVEVDRAGHERPLLEAPGSYVHLRLSPDGRAIAVEKTMANEELWVYDLDRGSGTRFAVGWDNQGPVWTPDGKQLVFTCNRVGTDLLFVGPVDGSAPVRELTSGDNHQYSLDITPDGRTLVYLEVPGPGRELWRLSLEGKANPQKVAEAPGNEWDARLSPDGRWLAYESDESGRGEIYVRPFPGPGGRQVVSAGGGYMPRWTRGGREIVYAAADGTIMSVAITAAATLTVSKPQPLWKQPHGAYLDYDVDPDGERFVFIVPGPSSEPARVVTVVTNWLEELKRLAPPGR
jgi:serine/threonine protein kinase/Tol biopolymer transport system component